MADLATLQDNRVVRAIINMRTMMRLSENQIIAIIRNRYGATSYTVARAAYEYALRSENAAARLGTLGQNERLRARDLPRARDGCTQWRYYLLVYARDVNTGEVEVIPWEIQSTSSLTRAELWQQTQADVQAWTGTQSAYKFNNPAVRSYAMDSIVYHGVARACP